MEITYCLLSRGNEMHDSDLGSGTKFFICRVYSLYDENISYLMHLCTYSIHSYMLPAVTYRRHSRRHLAAIWCLFTALRALAVVDGC